MKILAGVQRDILEESAFAVYDCRICLLMATEML
jgi:hypothetical protein